MLAWTEQGLQVEELPGLPVPLELAAGGVLGDTLYVLGGGGPTAAPGGADRGFALDLAVAPEARRWVELPWPEGAPGRRIAVAAVVGAKLYLFGGASPTPAGRAPPGSRFLRDAYAYAPGFGWQRLADPPRGLAGAAGPAMLLADGRLAIWGGLDAPWAELRATMRAFEAGFLVYDPATDRWGQVPAGPPEALRLPSRLNAVTVPWAGGYAILGGETAARMRTPTTAWVTFQRGPPGGSALFREESAIWPDCVPADSAITMGVPCPSGTVALPTLGSVVLLPP